MTSSYFKIQQLTIADNNIEANLLLLRIIIACHVGVQISVKKRMTSFEIIRLITGVQFVRFHPQGRGHSLSECWLTTYQTTRRHMPAERNLYRVTYQKIPTTYAYTQTSEIQASSDNPLPTFRDNISVPSSRVKKPMNLDFLTLEGGTDTLSPKSR
jgi:hypothetical protein